MLKVAIYIFMLFLSLAAVGQNRIFNIENQLSAMEVDFPGLAQPVETSLRDVNLGDFIRGIASANGLNVTVEQGIDTRVTNNFSNAAVKDVFIFLCSEYDLTIDFVGSIMSFKKYVPPPLEPLPVKARKIDVTYINETDFLSLNLKNDTLFNVAKAITKISPRNVVIAPGIEDQLVSVFIQNRPFANALEKFAFANNLSITETQDNFFLISKANGQKEGPSGFIADAKNKGGQREAHYQDGHLEVELLDGYLNIVAENVPIADILKEVSHISGKNYFMFTVPTGNSTLWVENAVYDNFLTYLLNGTNFTYKKAGEVYLVGERTQEKLRTTELIQLQNRTIESVMDIIPQELKKDVEIKEFVELNGFIVSGSYLNIAELRNFLREIDIRVPVVLIDVMIVEVKKEFNMETGLELGLGGENVPEKTIGGYNQEGSPGMHTTMNNITLNRLLNSFNGFGFINLGKLAPDFYASIKVLEENGVLHRKSTPKLATLNGHEASLSLGSTEYYPEVNNSFIGAQTPALSASRIYKPINADLSVVIKPIVSGDEQITLNIDFQQSNFTARQSPDAPPGSQNKDFSSIVRVRNGETVLLGGLDEKTSENSGKGLPYIARIPVLKWIFGSNSRKKSKNQINIFIKPTIIY